MYNETKVKAKNETDMDPPTIIAVCNVFSVHNRVELSPKLFDDSSGKNRFNFELSEVSFRSVH